MGCYDANAINVDEVLCYYCYHVVYVYPLLQSDNARNPLFKDTKMDHNITCRKNNCMNETPKH